MHLQKKICFFGLKVKYDTETETSLRICLFSALAFFPVEQVVDAFKALSDEEHFSPEALPIIDYFEDTWIGPWPPSHDRATL